LSERFAPSGAQAALPTASARGPRTLPVAATSLVGREQAIARPDPGTPGRTLAPG
jgi:hypothetical protein